MSHPSYSTRPTLRIDLPQLKANYAALKALAPTAKVAASVKADAYGLGAEFVGRALYGAGCRIFFVATAGEGKILRDAIGPNGAIYVLNGPAPRDKGVLLGAKLKPVINTIGQARYWAEVSQEVHEPPFTAIHIDTGMNRLGLSEAEVDMLASDRALWRALNPEWVMSHLACASLPDHPLNAEQLQRFKRQAAKLPPTPMSLASTAGIYLGKAYHFGLVRPGIGLYGGAATQTPDKEVTKPVVRLLAPILQTRDVKQGESVGYDARFIAPRDMRVATVGAGYADGIPVALTNQGHAIIHDQPAPIVGRISMDLTTLDVTDIVMPVQIGNVVQFHGDQLSALAREAGTIDYELLVRLGQRLRRDYLKGDGERPGRRDEAGRPDRAPRADSGRKPGRYAGKPSGKPGQKPRGKVGRTPPDRFSGRPPNPRGKPGARSASSAPRGGTSRPRPPGRPPKS